LLVLSLAEIPDADALAAGPKAAVLSRMLRAGLPVPPGFCIVADAHRRHLGEGDLPRRIGGALAALDADPAKSPAPALAEIRRWIAEGSLAPGLREEIERSWRALGAPAAAVRSSATAEDLPGRSFAGQYDSFLGILDSNTCLDRVKDCWTSLWSDRAFEYRRLSGIDHLKAEMAVIVQALVPADSAGVMFTADPSSGRRDCSVIEAGFGLGPAACTSTSTRSSPSGRLFEFARGWTRAPSSATEGKEPGLRRPCASPTGTFPRCACSGIVSSPPCRASSRGSW
jgi:pyruvate,water dikinase